MKKLSLFLIFTCLFSSAAYAEAKCFLAKEHDQIVKQEGDCKTRHSPESTFKIPLSLMGYDANILIDEAHPEWPFKKDYDLAVNVCKEPHNPRTWMRDSCVWYSQVLTQKLGVEKFREYVTKFNYGNQDVAGDKGKQNGLTHAWLSSSLEISPEEQTIFLQKLIDHNLPLSSKAHDMTKKNMFVQELWGGWKLYGKTGSGQQLNSGRSKKLDLKHGWFIGWIEKDGRTLTFASHITDDKKQEIFGSFRAKNEALIKLWYLIDQMAK
ncbi:MAG: bla [Gammaproteobacteria bacterium]|jgi:beta-lactamase class D|nr:bla [Gammaproteobacteria bacterium]